MKQQNVISIDCVKLEFWNRKALAEVHIMNGNEPINEPINELINKRI